MRQSLNWLALAASSVAVSWGAVLLTLAVTASARISAHGEQVEGMAWEASRVLLGVFGFCSLIVTPVLVVLGFFASRRQRAKNSN